MRLIDVVNNEFSRLGFGLACKKYDVLISDGNSSKVLYSTLKFLPLSEGDADSYLPHQVATGITQVLPIIVGLSLSDIKLTVKQPELHLHPALQLKLADSVLSSSLNLNNQIFMETHSEHITLRILKRIRQSKSNVTHINYKLSDKDVSILCLDKRGNSTICYKQEVSDDGEITSKWPGGFFEERFSELFDD